MQKFTMDTESWDAFWERWRGAVRQMPGMKEQMLEKTGGRIRDEVKSDVEAAGVEDTHGRVKLWQQRYVGSKKGYTAVRAESVDVPAGYRRKRGGMQSEVLNAGALTNFLARGHKARAPSGRAKRYRPEARMSRVKGHDFYKMARAQAEKISIQEAKALLQQLIVTELQL